MTACGGDGGGGSNTRLAEGGTGTDIADTDDTDTDSTFTGVKIGNGTGTNFTQGVLGADDTSLQAGGSTTLRVNFVDANNDALGAAVVVDFTSNCYAMGLAQFSDVQVTTNSGGFGTTTYTANGCSGDDEIVATATVDEQVLTASVTVSIEADEVLSISFVEAGTTTLNLAGTGGTETTVVTFQLEGAQGASIVGESVSFAIQGEEGDATLAPNTQTDISNAEGLVSTVLQSGTVATNIKVVATHDSTGITAVSDSISISAGLPIQKSFSISAETFNPPISNGTDGIESRITVIAADQFGNPVSEGTQVSFWTECGIIDANCTIEDRGCSVLWTSNNANQRYADGRCSVLAFTEGVETFDDYNGNFVYEGVDVFDSLVDDLPEPWLDSDENGERNSGEDFVDTSNGVIGEYDQPNGQWDGLCLNGIYPNAVCDGDDSAVVFQQLAIATTCSAATLIGAAPAIGSTIDLSGGGQVEVGVTVSDDCFTQNAAANGTTVNFSADGFEILTSESQVVPSNLSVPSNFSVVIRTDGTGGGGELKLELTVPNGETSVYFWNVID
ncbi:hypothetical protein [Halioxenophilus aromaticivorans]|uniref:hypothetical protein n=1 Tax=Halioxenophilus aromaticivorans TaxID=1306992 RepID=UPI0031EF56A0